MKIISPDELHRRLSNPGADRPDETTDHVDTGFKADDGKVRHDLLPVRSLESISRVLTIGAVKYGDRNWEAGMRWGRVYAATLRHLFAWFAGEDKDPETGEPHLSHAGCCILFLIHYALTSTGQDDRPAHQRTTP